MSSRTRAVVAVSAFAAFFLVVGVTALVVGVHDASIAAGSLGVLLASIVLVLMGALFVMAAWRLATMTGRSAWPGDARPPCKEPIPIALLVAVILGSYVFFGALGAAGLQRWILITVSVVFIAVGSAGMGFFWRDVDTSVVRVGASIALAVAGIAIGLGEFWYQNQYVPSHLGRAVSLQADMKIVGEQKDDYVVSVALGYQDIGGRSVAVIGSTYTLTGSRVIQCERTATPARLRDVLGGFLADPQRSRFMADTWEKQPATVLAAGKFVGDGKRLDPNVPASRQLIFYVPRHRYQLLRFRAQLFAISASVPLSQRALPEYKHFPSDNYLYGFWHVTDDSWLHDLLSGRQRWVITRYEVVSEPQSTAASPDLRVTARFPPPTWTVNRPSITQIHNLFSEPEPSDASEPFTDAELPLEPVAQPSARDHPPSGCTSATR